MGVRPTLLGGAHGRGEAEGEPALVGPPEGAVTAAGLWLPRAAPSAAWKEPSLPWFLCAYVYIYT